MNKRYLFFDVECANCFNGKGKLCSFGYVLTDENFNIIIKEDRLINPKSKWDWYVVKKMLGYPKSEFESKPGFDKEYPFIKELLENPEYLVFGSGISNDIKHLKDDCERYGLPEIEFVSRDVQNLYSRYKEEKEKKSLTKMARELEIDCQALKEHISRNDAEITMLITKAVCERLNSAAHDLISKL